MQYLTRRGQEKLNEAVVVMNKTLQVSLLHPIVPRMLQYADLFGRFTGDQRTKHEY